MSLTNWPNGIFATPNIGGGIMTGPKCEVLFVDYATGSDGNDGKSWDTALKTLSQAHSNVTTNSNSVIYVNGNSAVVETAMINFTKSRVHVVGVNGPYNPGGYGCGARVQIGVTTDTDDIALIANTGVRNTFTNIKFISANTLAQALYCVAEGGEYTRYYGCEFYKSTHLTAAASGNLAAEVLCNGDSAQFYDCWFGDLVNSRGTAGSCVRANVSFDREQLTGKVARDVTFRNCRFNVKAADSGVAHCYITAATDIERSLVFDNCQFWNAHLAAADPGEAILIAAAQTEGKILLINPSTIDCTAHASASTGAYLTGGSAPVDTTTGIAAIIDS
jgi:hypothetical protein